MDLSTEKLKLMEWLISLEDKSIVSRIQEIRKETLKSAESYQLSNPEKLFLEAGLKDVEQGNTHPHEDVMKEIKEKYGI